MVFLLLQSEPLQPSLFMARQPGEQEQGLNSSTEQEQGPSESLQIQVFFAFLSTLGFLLPLKAKDVDSLFEEHKGIIYIFVVNNSIYAGTILVGKKLGTKAIGLIQLLSGTIAPILLFLILVPELGWLALGLWVILAAKTVWDYLSQRYHDLRHRASRAFNILDTVMTRNSGSVEGSQEPAV